MRMCQWEEVLFSAPDILLSSKTWPWHSVWRSGRFSGCSKIPCSFLKRKLQRNRIVTVDKGSYRENSNRMVKSFHLLLKNFSHRDASHLSHNSSFNCQADGNKFYHGSYKSGHNFLFSKEGLTEAFWRKTKQRRIREGEEKVGWGERVRGSEDGHYPSTTTSGKG